MELLIEVVLVYGLAILVLLVFSRIKVHPIVGFLLTGLIAGPFGIGIITDVGEVEELAEIGILLLLFTIGIELSINKLLQVKQLVLLGGSLQVLLTIAATFIVAQFFGRTLEEALFIGFLFSLSSTAIVLKILQDQGYIDSLYGKTTLGILIFQDIIIVPMMLVTPYLADEAEVGSQSFLKMIGLGILLMAGVFLAARFVIPAFFYMIARTRSRELFLLFVVVICFSVAFITSEIGLSLSLGAFIAGLIISESEYSHNAMSSILPLRDLFTSLFFVSVGMLLDINYLFQNFFLVVGITIGVAILKATIILFIGILLRLTMRTILLAALALWQVGEFAFILSHTGIEYDLISTFDYQLFLSVSILTMVFTPLVLMKSPKWVDKLSRQPFILKFGKKIESEAYRNFPDEDTRDFNDHLVIIGYGLNGKNVAKAAKLADIPYIIIESNPETVITEKKKGENIFFGDASQDEILNHAKITKARVVVIAISDPLATERIVVVAKRLNPKIHLIVRTRYIAEMNNLMKYGADEVIPEEFETSVEIFTRLLSKYLVPKSEIDNYIKQIRSEGYAMFRNIDSFYGIDLHLSDMEVIKMTVNAKSPWLNQKLLDLAFRKNYDATILSIKRGNHVIQNPDGKEIIEAGDELILLGTPEVLQQLNKKYGIN